MKGYIDTNEATNKALHRIYDLLLGCEDWTSDDCLVRNSLYEIKGIVGIMNELIKEEEE